MGLFDIFNTNNADQAAFDQTQGIQTGLNQLSNSFASGRDALTSNINAGAGQNSTNINAGIGALGTNVGNANSALSSNFMAGLQPYLNNYSSANAGVGQLMSALGINSPSGGGSPIAGTPTGPGPQMSGVSGPTTANTAQGTLQSANTYAGPGTPGVGSGTFPSGPAQPSSIQSILENTPGYNFAKTQGDNSILAQNAASGKTGSGGEAMALSNYNQGLADTTYNNYISQLQPFLGAQNSAAQGVGSMYGQLGTGTSQNFNNLGSGTLNALTNLGNTNLGAYTALGGGLNSNYINLGNAQYGANSSIGNAQANAALAGNNASANMLGALGGLGGALFSFL